MSQFTDEKGITHADENWEDTWDAGLEMDLGTESLNSELFFSCTVVLGSRVRLLMVEPTGEVRFHSMPPLLARPCDITHISHHSNLP